MLNLFKFVGWIVFVLFAVRWCSGGGDEPKAAVAPKPKYPDRVLIYKGEGGPDLYQRLTPQFQIDKELEQSELGLKGYAFAVAMTAAANGKNCDQLDYLGTAPIQHRVAFRVSCIGDDGHYRTYKMWRHIDDKNGNFKMDYWEK